MKQLDDLWLYQTKEIEYEEYEEAVKNTETRKKMVKYKKVFTTKQEHLKKLESESAAIDTSLNDIAKQIEKYSKEIDEKNTELSELYSTWEELM